jgi:CheY-like chemotaxis protein
MNTVHAVCLLGFSAFERQALTAHFRLALQRKPAYRLVDTLVEARLAVVNADAPAACEDIARANRKADAVYIGAHAPLGEQARLPRPIDVLAVLRELDAMLLMNVGASPDRTTAKTSPGTRAPATVPTPDEPMRTAPVALAPASMLSELADLFPDRQEGPAAAEPRCDALVVDDSEIAQRFLLRRLADLGIRAHAVGTSQEAIAYLARHRVRLALLDVELGAASDQDGLNLCRLIKRDFTPAPVVAIVSAHHGSTDRVRGSLAGCDAYLGKPLQPAELADLVARTRRSDPKHRHRAKPLS